MPRSTVAPLVFVAALVFTIADALYCGDRSRCQRYDTCTDEDALHRSGHLCETLPWYTGGAPLFGQTPWDDVNATYDCMDVPVNGSAVSSGPWGACQRWRFSPGVDLDDADGRSAGQCACDPGVESWCVDACVIVLMCTVK